MAKFIETIHLVFADLEGKNIATKHPPEKVDRALFLVIIDLFNKYLDQYVKTTKISDYLLPFKAQKTLNLSGGSVELPGDYAHHRTVFDAVTGLEIDIIEDKFWDKRKNSKLSPPSLTHPIGRIEMSEGANPTRSIEVFPNTVTSIKILYFKYPVAPKYAYTSSGDRYVYDEANSIDVEFPTGLYPDIVNRLLSYFGIVLREGQVTQIAEMLKAQEQAK